MKGPTCHYVMGGVEVGADSQATTVPGFTRGEVAGGGRTALTGWAAIRFRTCSCSASERGSTPQSTPKDWVSNGPCPLRKDVVQAGEVAFGAYPQRWR